MPTAICGACGKARPWRAQRGERLADLRCERGEPMGRTVWTEAGWVPAPTASKAKGRKMECCALCGRRSSVPGGGVRLTQDTVFQIHYRGEPYGQTDARNVPAGAVVCWSHSSDYPVLLVCKAIDPDVCSKPRRNVWQLPLICSSTATTVVSSPMTATPGRMGKEGVAPPPKQ